MLRRCLGLLLAGIVAGCGGGGAPPAGEPGTGAGSAGAGASGTGVQVGMVTDVGGVGDLSFNMMANNGLQKAVRELGITPSLVESRQPADYVSNLQRMAEKGCKVVIAVGFALEPAVKEVAARYPETRFAIIDSEGPAASNVANLVFREEEGSFLVGALAGGMTKSQVIGFVGGMEIPLIRRFEAGYRAGVRTTRPAAVVQAKYTNNWEDVAKGKELAVSLFNQGADVVMHASGQCGLGVIQAAREKGPGFWAIGVDADQDYLGTEDPKNPAPPSRVLTSMMKRVDNAVFTICKEVVEGGFQAGKREFGVRDDGVGLSPLLYTREAIPEKLLQEVERLKGLVAGGTVRPPRTLEELDGWKAPAATP